MINHYNVLSLHTFQRKTALRFIRNGKLGELHILMLVSVLMINQ